MSKPFWKNPWVLIGGAGIGLVILLTRSGGGDSSSGVVAQGAPLDYLAELNQIGANSMLGLAEIAGNRAIAQLNADTVLKASVLDMMNTRLIKTRDMVSASLLAQSGIAENAIVANAMAIQARQENGIRGALASIYPGTQLAKYKKHGANGSIQNRSSADIALRDISPKKDIYQFPHKRDKNSYQINPPVGRAAS